MEPVQESIFSSAIRGLCKAFAIMIGIFIALLPIFFVIGMLGKEADISSKTSISFLPDLEGENEIVSPGAPAILQINVHGVIGKKDGITAEDVRYQLIDSRKNILKNDRVKGVLLHMKTPGGSAMDSDTIYRLVTAYKKKYDVPVYAYIDGLCASGGMYTAAAADRIYSAPVSIIGSIGVIMGPFFNFTGTMEKIGIKALTLTEGKDKDAMNMFRPWKENEAEPIKAIGTYLYETFVDIMVQNRPRLNKSKLINDYGARVFDPPVAEEYGYIDVSDSSYNDALKDLLQEAKIDINEPYQVVELKTKSSWLQELVRGESPIFTGKIKHEFPFVSEDYTDSFSFLFEPGNSNSIVYK